MFHKKFLTTLIAVFLLIYGICTPIASAENSTSIQSVISINFEGDESFVKFLNSLPQKKVTSYKSKQRPILLEGAMNVEINKLVKALKNPTVYRILNYVYIAGTYKNYPVIVARTEQGMENAAAVTALAIENFKPIAVINQGTAGGHIAEAEINSIIIGNKYINYAAIITEKTPADAGVKIFPQEMRGTFAYDKDKKNFRLFKEYLPNPTLLKIAEEVAASDRNFHTLTGTISSADSWLNGIDHYKCLNENYGSLAEEMETCSAAQICQSSNVPFIGIRVISDNSIISPNHYEETSVTCQDFVLIVVERYIKNLKSSL